jgi:hypothetical protein
MKTAKAELEARKAAWAYYEQHREEILAAVVHNSSLAGLDPLAPLRRTPAMAFLITKRRQGVALRTAMLDLLLRTDIPLDPDTRRRMFETFQERTKEQERLDKDREMLAFRRELKDHLHFDRGYTMPEAEKAVAKALGYKKVGGLLSAVKRARKKTQRRP